MKNSSIKEAQKALHIWLSHFDKRSYTSIKETCDYLNSAYELEIKGSTIWAIFFPLVYAGVAEHAGNDYYALTEPLDLAFDSVHFVTNPTSTKDLEETEFPGIYKSSTAQPYKTIKVNPLSILKSIPYVKDVIDTWGDSLQDEECFTYRNWKKRQGIAELKQGGLIRFFSIPKNLYIKELPARSINPDAYNIAMSYERVVNSGNAGTYNVRTKQLILEKFGLPILLYRAIILCCMEQGNLPIENDFIYIFNNIDEKIVKEINRILGKTIVYE